MYKIVKSDESTERKIFENKRAYNYITKDFSPGVSLAVIEASDFTGEVTIDKDRVYYVLEGILLIEIEGQRNELHHDDTIFIKSGAKYIMSGTFRTITIDQPAFGS